MFIALTYLYQPNRYSSEMHVSSYFVPGITSKIVSRILHTYTKVAAPIRKDILFRCIALFTFYWSAQRQQNLRCHSVLININNLRKSSKLRITQLRQRRVDAMLDKKHWGNVVHQTDVCFICICFHQFGDLISLSFIC